MKLTIITTTIVLLTLAFTQPYGEITGQILELETGKPIVGANLVIPGTNLGAAADETGVYVIRLIPAGVYTVQSSAIGYEIMQMTDVVVTPARPVRADFNMLETITEASSVTVNSGPFRKPAGKQISTLVQTNEEIRRLPGGSEDVVRAISILPGVAQVQAGRNDLIVRGGAPSENLYVVDGC